MKLAAATIEAIIAALIDTGGPFDPADTYVAISPTIVDHGDATVMADVTEPPGDLATRVLITAWGTPYRLSDGRWVVDGPVCLFTPADDGDASVIRWYFMADANAAGVLKGFTRLSADYALLNENTPLHVLPRLTVDPSGRWDLAIVWNS